MHVLVVIIVPLIAFQLFSRFPTISNCFYPISKFQTLSKKAKLISAEPLSTNRVFLCDKATPNTYSLPSLMNSEIQHYILLGTDRHFFHHDFTKESLKH